MDMKTGKSQAVDKAKAQGGDKDTEQCRDTRADDLTWTTSDIVVPPIRNGMRTPARTIRIRTSSWRHRGPARTAFVR